MIIRRADEKTESEAMPTEGLMAAMLKYHEEMANAGILLQGEGLRASRVGGARIQIGGKTPVVTEGPFPETRELIAGFTIIQVKSREEALDWVKRWPVEDGPVTLELRQVFEAEDFGEAFTPELREAEDRLRGRITT
jgi:hypothetical protein